MTRSVPVGQQNAAVVEVLALARTEPAVSLRTGRALRRALREERLVLAGENDRVIGFLLSEPCGRGVQELGFTVVSPGSRGTGCFAEMLKLALFLEPTTVAVTFDPGFATWLIQERGFRRSTLGQLVRISRGWFLVHRLLPSRLAAAIGRTRAADAWYLVCKAHER